MPTAGKPTDKKAQWWLGLGEGTGGGGFPDGNVPEPDTWRSQNVMNVANIPEWFSLKCLVFGSPGGSVG